MSYDLYLRSVPCEHCKRYDEGPMLPDPTYNLTPVFDLALTGEPLPNPDVAEGYVVLAGAKTDRPRGLRVLHGRKGSDTLVMLRNALARLQDPEWETRFKVLEPKSWGTLRDSVDVLHDMLKAAEKYPDHIWEIR